MNVKFLDIAATYNEQMANIDQAVNRVLHSGWYILGNEVKNFERNFAGYCGAKFCSGVSNGLDAISLALRAHCIGAGDEVIVPAHTFIATWFGVTHTSAKVVPIDVDEKTFNINPDLIQKAITDKTKAIVPVHLYGQPADLDAINKIAKENNLVVIEDAAQAHGALYKGSRIGSSENTVCFSFYPGKNLGAFGDGGAVVTNNEKVLKRLKTLANYGSEVKYTHNEIGFNCRLDEIQAAILNVKLTSLEMWNTRRRRIAETYLSGIKNEFIKLPAKSGKVEHVWHLFVIRTEFRDELQRYLKEHGIDTIIHYPVPPFKQNAYSYLKLNNADYPVADKIAGEILSLPIGPHLKSEEVENVVSVINSFNPEAEK